MNVSRLVSSSAILLLTTSTLLAQTTAPSPRTADAILTDIANIKLPNPDQSRANDPQYVAQLRMDRIDAVKQRNPLIWELYEVDPTNGKLPQLLAARWSLMASLGDPTLAAEFEKVASNKAVPHIAALARDFRVQINLQLFHDEKATYNEVKAAVESCVAGLDATNPKVGQLLLTLASVTPDTQAKRTLLIKVKTDFATTPYAPIAAGFLRQIDGIGKPVELKFNDLITGKEVSVAALKGKIVIIDFWATWCVPCVAEMPRMKKLYTEYKDKGVEFIGVSLDKPPADGGLDKVIEFIAKNEIPWPQYYQGNYLLSEFSKSWGIESIPAMFILDTNGNLVTTSGRTKLETLIPELLEKAKTVVN